MTEPTGRDEVEVNETPVLTWEKPHPAAAPNRILTACLLQGKPATSHVIGYLIQVTFKWQQLLEKQFDPVSCEFRDAEGYTIKQVQ